MPQPESRTHGLHLTWNCCRLPALVESRSNFRFEQLSAFGALPCFAMLCHALPCFAMLCQAASSPYSAEASDRTCPLGDQHGEAAFHLVAHLHKCMLGQMANCVLEHLTVISDHGPPQSARKESCQTSEAMTEGAALAELVHDLPEGCPDLSL